MAWTIEQRKIYNKQYYQKNRTTLLSLQRKWREKNKDHISKIKREWKLKNKEKQDGYRKEWDAKNKKYYLKRRQEKTRLFKAQQSLNRFVRLGKVLKPNKCSICGTLKLQIEAHHEDYNKPLEVIWLCRSCHTKLHYKIRNQGFVLA